ncbi:uncharacterized protein LOC143030098 [Oratosquilla oratoria]|uniref:uncharacterized protein LOC143030098 n=1 Tax=Oratosquilla oratoria TaxID=337810 RepID=UPI003F769614
MQLVRAVRGGCLGRSGPVVESHLGPLVRAVRGGWSEQFETAVQSHEGPLTADNIPVRICHLSLPRYSSFKPTQDEYFSTQYRHLVISLQRRNIAASIFKVNLITDLFIRNAEYNMYCTALVTRFLSVTGLPKDSQRIHGVGFAVRRSLLNSLPEAPVGVNECLMTLRLPLMKQRYVTLISCYAPTLPSPDEIKKPNKFYKELDNLLHNLPKNEKVIILGDFNARVGSNFDVWQGVIGRHGTGKENSNGIRLLNLCSTHDFTITNTVFQLSNKYKMSWKHPRSKHWHQIDFIITRKADLRDFLITRALRGADTPQHYFPAMGYQKSQIESDWKTFSDSIYFTLTDTFGFSTRNHQDWYDQSRADILDLLRRKNNAHLAALNNPTSNLLKQKFQALRQEAQRVLRRIQNQWWSNKTVEIQQYAELNDQQNFNNSIKTTYGPTQSTKAPLMSADGATLIKDKNGILDRWVEYLSSLLNQNNPIDPTFADRLPNLPLLNNLDLTPSFTETLKACNSLKKIKHQALTQSRESSSSLVATS